MKSGPMMVTVKYFNLVRDRTGRNEQRFNLEEGVTVAGLLEKIKSGLDPRTLEYLFSPSGELKPHIRLVRGGTSRQEQAESELSDGDELYMFVATSGG